VLKVTITVEATAERNWVVVNDPVPPGATIVGNLGGQSGLLAQAGDGRRRGRPAQLCRARQGCVARLFRMGAARQLHGPMMRLNGTGRSACRRRGRGDVFARDPRAAEPMR
jgi:hypothetical protein